MNFNIYSAHAQYRPLLMIDKFKNVQRSNVAVTYVLMHMT